MSGQFFFTLFGIIVNSHNKSFPTLHDIQGIVDGFASKPALRQDTGYMVEKTYLDIAPYFVTDVKKRKT